MKRIKSTALILAALVAITGVFIALSSRHAVQRGPVMPKVGDVVYYRVDSDIGDYLCVRCTKAVGKLRILDVTYRRKSNKLWKPVYRVTIDYQAKYNDPHRVAVTDAHGHDVPRGRAVDGVPVPFHSLIFVLGDVVPPNRDTWYHLSGGWMGRARGWASDASLTPVSEPHYLKLDFQKDRQGYIDQLYWGGNDWLWKRAVHAGDDTRDLEIDMARCEKPK